MAVKARIAYVRVSTDDQRTDRQVSELDKLGIDKWFVEQASGKNTERDELMKMLDYVREGDDVFVFSMDRLARNLENLLSLVSGLTKKGVGVHFLKEKMDFEPDGSASPMARLMLSMMGAFAEFERALILERQREGIALAKKRGAYKGRKPVMEAGSVGEARRLLAEGLPVTRVAKRLGVSRSTLYRYLARPESGKTVVSELS